MRRSSKSCHRVVSIESSKSCHRVVSIVGSWHLSHAEHCQNVTTVYIVVGLVIQLVSKCYGCQADTSLQMVLQVLTA